MRWGHAFFMCCTPGWARSRTCSRVELNGTVGNMRALAVLAGTGILFAIYVTGALVADWRSGAAALIVAALVLTVFVGVNRQTRNLSRNVSDRNARILDLALQSFNNIKFLKATHTHARLRDRLQGVIDERRAFLKWQEALKTLVHAAMEPFAIAVIAAFILFSVAVRGETLATGAAADAVPLPGRRTRGRDAGGLAPVLCNRRPGQRLRDRAARARRRAREFPGACLPAPAAGHHAHRGGLRL